MEEFKINKFILRLSVVSFSGIILIYSIYDLKYHTHIFDFSWLFVIIGISFWIWSLFADFGNSRNKQNVSSLLTPTLGLVFIATVFLMKWKINSDFNKASLLKVYYNGDFNGVSIDFKKDGTYIYDNFCLGSDYEYGEYKINGDKIILDKDVIKTKELIIIPETIRHKGKTEIENYLYQVNEKGEILENETKFRVTFDNRKE